MPCQLRRAAASVLQASPGASRCLCVVVSPLPHTLQLLGVSSHGWLCAVCGVRGAVSVRCVRCVVCGVRAGEAPRAPALLQYLSWKPPQALERYAGGNGLCVVCTSSTSTSPTNHRPAFSMLSCRLCNPSSAGARPALQGLTNACSVKEDIFCI